MSIVAVPSLREMSLPECQRWCRPQDALIVSCPADAHIVIAGAGSRIASASSLTAWKSSPALAVNRVIAAMPSKSCLSHRRRGSCRCLAYTDRGLSFAQLAVEHVVPQATAEESLRIHRLRVVIPDITDESSPSPSPRRCCRSRSAEEGVMSTAPFDSDHCPRVPLRWSVDPTNDRVICRLPPTYAAPMHKLLASRMQ